MALQKTIYIGTFIQCETLTELDIIPNGMVGVDEHGKIAFVLRSFKGRRYPDNEGWEEAKIIRIQDHGFFFPGFIGTYCGGLIICRWRTNRRHRYTYPRISISECWHLWQVDTTGLVEYIHLPNGIILQRLRERSTSLQPSRSSHSIPRHNNSLLLRHRPRPCNESSG